jgi:hypothetical protein
MKEWSLIEEDICVPKHILGTTTVKGIIWRMTMNMNTNYVIVINIFFLWSLEIFRTWRSNNQTELKKSNICCHYPLVSMFTFEVLSSDTGTDFLAISIIQIFIKIMFLRLDSCLPPQVESLLCWAQLIVLVPIFKRELLDLIYSLLTSPPCLKTLLEIIFREFFLLRTFLPFGP